MFKKADMSHKYLLALKGVLIFCGVINTLHNVIPKLLNISCNWEIKQTKFKEKIKVKFKLNNELNTTKHFLRIY